MAATIKAKGIITFNPHERAPQFVLGTIAISLNQLNEWVKGDGKEYITDYKGEPQLKLQVTSLKEGRGIIVSVDTYRKDNSGVTESTAQPVNERGKKEEPFNGNSSDDDGSLPF